MNIRRYVTVVLPALGVLVACNGTETDNPVVLNEPPDYRSPVRFEPEPGPTRPCDPSDDDEPPRDLQLWGRSGQYLVGVDTVGVVPRRGLVVVDVSDPAVPRVVAEQPLYGYPRQLWVDGASVELVIDEVSLFDGTSVPEPGALDTHTKLVHFDLSTPSAPLRVADIALEGEFWRLQAADNGYWVMSARIDPETLRCEVPRNRCGYVSRTDMLFTRYTWDGAQFASAGRVELPAGPRAWMTEGGFATETRVEGSGGTIHFAAFAADGSVLPARTLEFSSGLDRYTPLYLSNGQLGVFTFVSSAERAVLVLYGSDGQELGRAAFRESIGPETRFVRGGALVAFNNASRDAAWIDFTNPSAMQVFEMPGVSALLPLGAPNALPTRVIGWKMDADAENPTFSLWGVGSGAPTPLSQLETSLRLTYGTFDVRLEADRVLVSALDPPGAPETATLRWDDDVLTMQGPIAGGYGRGPFGVGDWVYEPDARGLVFGNPSTGATEVQAWSDGETLDVVALGDAEARLVLDRGQGVKQLVLGADDNLESIRVSPGARRLLPAGNRLVVLSSESAESCAQTGLDCSGYVPGVAIVEQDPLRIIAEMPLPALDVPELSSRSRVQQRWEAYAGGLHEPVRLGERAWLLESAYSASCLTEADCSALGIASVPIEEANVIVGMLDCPPEPEVCPEYPAPTVYGSAERRMFYVVDAAAARLSAPLVVDGARGTPLDTWRRPRSSAGTLLDLHLDPPYDGRPQPDEVAFMLERYALNDAGGLSALPVLNIPGYPVALVAPNELLSVEPLPSENAEVRLYRLRLDQSGAHVLASRALAASFVAVERVGQSVVYIRGTSDACAPVTFVETYTLGGGFEPQGTLELPGSGWRVIDVAERSLLLGLPDRRSFARVTIGAGGTPTLGGFVTAPSTLQNVRVDANTLRGIAADSVVRLSL